MRRPGIVGWVVGALVAVTSVAVAAALTVVVTDSVAGGSAPVTVCDTSVGVDLGSPQYQNPPAQYVVGSVVISGLDAAACNGQTIRVTIADGAGNAASEAAEVIDSTAWTNPQTIALTQAIPVSDVSDVAVVISSN